MYEKYKINNNITKSCDKQSLASKNIGYGFIGQLFQRLQYTRNYLIK